MFISSNFANGKIYCSAVVNKILTAWSENLKINTIYGGSIYDTNKRNEKGF